MNVSPDILRRETVRLIREIDLQIEEVKKYAANAGVAPHNLRSTDGNWAMSPLLLAKAQAYNTLVQLQDKK
jgi:hypothetical protein